MTLVYTAIRHRRNPCILDHYDDGFYDTNSEAIRRRKQREADYHEECEELEKVNIDLDPSHADTV